METIDTINAKNLAIQKMGEKSCVYKCKEPGGSVLWALVTIIIVTIIVPMFVDMVSGAIPATIAALENDIYYYLEVALNYQYSVMPIELVFFAIGGLFAGIIALKQMKSLIISIALLGSWLVLFFFLAFFVIGTSVDYGMLFSSMFSLIGILKFLFVIIIPLSAGAFIAKILYARKHCYILNNATIIK